MAQAPTRTFETPFGAFIAEFRDEKVGTWGRRGVKGGRVKSVEPVNLREVLWNVDSQFWVVHGSGSFSCNSTIGTPNASNKNLPWPKEAQWKGAHRDLLKAIKGPIMTYLEDPELQAEIAEYKRLDRIEYLEVDIERDERQIARLQEWNESKREELRQLKGE